MVVLACYAPCWQANVNIHETLPELHVQLRLSLIKVVECLRCIKMSTEVTLNPVVHATMWYSSSRTLKPNSNSNSFGLFSGP